ncbi:MAG: hypothetical protein QXG65_03335 [Thermoplasmata archaeon]
MPPPAVARSPFWSQIPIRVTNPSASAIPSPFDLRVVVNSSLYRANEAPDLANVEFSYPNGTVIPSWLESGASANATATVYWLNLTGGIPAGGTVGLSMDLAAPTVSLRNNRTVGEAPTLSPIYGEYDDGVSVFPFYDNFAGTYLNGTRWVSTVNVSVSVSDGLNVTSGPHVLGALLSRARFPAGTVVEASIDAFAGIDGFGFVETAVGGQYATGYGAVVQSACGVLSPEESNPNGSANPCGAVYGTFSGGLPSASNPRLVEVEALNASAMVGAVNGSRSGNGTRSEPLTGFPLPYPLPVGVDVGGSPIGSPARGEVRLQWVLARTMPPGGIMPSVSVGLPVATVRFAETGLTAGTVWGVELNGTWANTTAPNPILFGLNATGTLPYRIRNVAGYHESTLASQGTLSVANGTTNITLAFSPLLSSVVFQESGLPNGTAWGVSVNGTRFTATSPSAITIPRPNGSFSYRIEDVSGWHQTTLPYSGNGTVAGPTLVEPTLLFVRVVYAVTFGEGGLPNGTIWSVTLNGSLRSAVAPANLSTALANGTYAYRIGSVPGYVQSTLPGTGNVSVAGGPVTMPVLRFLRVAYAVRFSERGLPNGTSWAVRIEGTRLSAVAPAPITENLSNGTYAYAIADVPGWHQTTLAYTGSFVVNGSPVTEPTLVFSVFVGYTIRFNETGLPATARWNVTVNGSGPTRPAGTPIVIGPLPNGTFPYRVADVPGWHQETIPYAGSVAVAGASLVEPTLVFTVYRGYRVTFLESGLPSGLAWSVAVNGTLGTAPAGASIVSGPWGNGSFSYSIGDVAGWHQTTLPYRGNGTIDGASVTEPTLAFVVFRDYAVLFRESGLPSGTPWSVAINGTAYPVSAGQPIVSVPLPNGTFTYAIADVPGWHQSTLPYSGSGTIAGANVSEPTLLFVPVRYAVRFHESGLPSSVAWSVTFDGQPSGPLRTAYDNWTASNGSASYAIGVPPGWEISGAPAQGTLEVRGGPVWVNVTFRPATFLVRFEAIGLGGLPWTVSINGSVAYAGTAASVSESLPNGTYAFAIGPRTGWLRTPANGTLTVAGFSVTIRVVWHFLYTVRFEESGLPNGTAWGIAVNASGVPEEGPAPAPLAFALWNGSFAYRVLPVPGYVTAWSGTVAVAGADRVVSIVFAPYLERIVFNESGLPQGTGWEIVLDLGTVGRLTQGAAAPEPIVLMVPNGTYFFTVPEVPGYTAIPSSGFATAAAHPPSIPILFRPLPPGPGGSVPRLLFPAGTGVSPALVALAILIPLAGSVAFLLATRRRPPAGARGRPR